MGPVKMNHLLRVYLHPLLRYFGFSTRCRSRFPIQRHESSHLSRWLYFHYLQEFYYICLPITLVCTLNSHVTVVIYPYSHRGISIPYYIFCPSSWLSGNIVKSVMYYLRIIFGPYLFTVLLTLLFLSNSLMNPLF